MKFDDLNQEEPIVQVVEEEAEQAKHVSRTTAWRKRKAETAATDAAVGESKTLETKKNKPRKEYTCKKCGKPMTSSGHTQYRGNRYCPQNNLQSKEEWLKEMRGIDCSRSK